MSEPGDGGGGTPADEEGGGLRRWGPITLAAIVLLGAMLAVLQTDASIKEANTARETTRTAVQSQRAGVIERAVLGVEDQIAAEGLALAFRRPLDDDPAALERARASLPDPRESERIEELSFEAERLSLSRAALTETRVTWNDRSTQYTTVIAVLALALFFVGFAVVVRGPLRRYFYSFGLIVALICVVWTAYIYALSIPETDDEAIRQAARGAVHLQRGRAAEALAAYDRAVGLDGDFAAAYSGRATAGLAVTNPDLFATGAVTDRSLRTRRALEDAERALEISEDGDVAALGLVALASFYAGDFPAAERRAARILELNDRAAAAALLASAAHAGQGDEEAAQQTLEQAGELLQGVAATRAVRRLARNALTWFEFVADDIPERQALANRLALEVIAGETALALDADIGGTAPSRGSIRIEDLRVEEGRFAGRVVYRDLPPGTPVTILGYERPQAGAALVQPAELAAFRRLGGSGEESFSAPVDRSCLPVQVQARVYLDGAPAGRATARGVAATC